MALKPFSTRRYEGYPVAFPEQPLCQRYGERAISGTDISVKLMPDEAYGFSVPQAPCSVSHPKVLYAARAALCLRLMNGCERYNTSATSVTAEMTAPALNTSGSYLNSTLWAPTGTDTERMT